MAVGVTLIKAVDAPVDHNILPSQLLADNVASLPLQIVSAEAVIVGGARFITVIKASFDGLLTQPSSIQIAEYTLIGFAGLTIIVAPVALVFQVTVPSQPLAINVRDSPKQILSLPQVIIGIVGFGVTVITLDAFPLHPAFVQVKS
jgi:hypothetical protein